MEVQSDTRRRTIDALEQAIRRLSARMDAACYEQLVLIREFDERAGWLEWTFGNCSDWLAWRCDISLSAAREKVRVAAYLVAAAEYLVGLRRRVAFLHQGPGIDPRVAPAKRDRAVALCV